MNPIELSIVIPAFNEAENIPIVIRDTVATLDASRLKGRYELLLINDGSTDATPGIVDEMARQYSCVRAFHHEGNKGLGEGLKTGYRNSRGAYLTFIGADGEIEVDQVLRLYDGIGDADMMTSTRLGYATNNAIQQRSFYRGLLSWGFRLCIRVILGCNAEKLTGIYLVRGPIVRSLPLHSKTSLINLEIYLHCLYSGAKMAHGTITLKPRISGVSKVANASGAWKQLWEMIKLRNQIRQHIGQQPKAETPMSKAA